MKTLCKILNILLKLKLLALTVITPIAVSLSHRKMT